MFEVLYTQFDLDNKKMTSIQMVPPKLSLRELRCMVITTISAVGIFLSSVFHCSYLLVNFLHHVMKQKLFFFFFLKLRVDQKPLPDKGRGKFCIHPILLGHRLWGYIGYVVVVRCMVMPTARAQVNYHFTYFNVLSIWESPAYLWN